MPIRKVSSDLNELSREAAEFFVAKASDAIDRTGRFTVSLSGGSTPKALYRLLSSEFGSRVDWARVNFFFGDERFVPVDSNDSNFRMVNLALFEPLRIPDSNIFRWKTELDSAEVTAADYDTRMAHFFELNLGQLPRFDVTLLGLGEDGHTASLFPDTTALEIVDRLAVANWVHKMETYRLTMTFPVINNSAVCAFLAAGESKADVLAKIQDHASPTAYPAERVAPIDGELYWFLDEAAASKLTSV
jgi:6-phosphogluconolactonase